MSTEAANAFVERMKTDEEFQKRILAIKDAEERRVVACAEGYKFTADEYKEAAEVLSEDELDEVAGGICLLNGLVDVP